MQLVFLAITTDFSGWAMLGSTLVATALVEEIAKSLGIVVLAERGCLPSAARRRGCAHRWEFYARPM